MSLELYGQLMFAAATAAKSLQSCLTLCDPRDGSPPGSPRPWDSPGKDAGAARFSCSRLIAPHKGLLSTPRALIF